MKAINEKYYNNVEKDFLASLNDADLNQPLEKIRDFKRGLQFETNRIDVRNAKKTFNNINGKTYKSKVKSPIYLAYLDYTEQQPLGYTMKSYKAIIIRLHLEILYYILRSGKIFMLRGLGQIFASKSKFIHLGKYRYKFKFKFGIRINRMIKIRSFTPNVRTRHLIDRIVDSEGNNFDTLIKNKFVTRPRI